MVWLCECRSTARITRDVLYDVDSVRWGRKQARGADESKRGLASDQRETKTDGMRKRKAQVQVVLCPLAVGITCVGRSREGDAHTLLVLDTHIGIHALHPDIHVFSNRLLSLRTTLSRSTSRMIRSCAQARRPGTSRGRASGLLWLDTLTTMIDRDKLKSTYSTQTTAVLPGTVIH